MFTSFQGVSIAYFLVSKLWTPNKCRTHCKKKRKKSVRHVSKLRFLFLKYGHKKQSIGHVYQKCQCLTHVGQGHVTFSEVLALISISVYIQYSYTKERHTVVEIRKRLLERTHGRGFIKCQKTPLRGHSAHKKKKWRPWRTCQNGHATT